MMEPLKGRLADLVASEREDVAPPQDAKARHWAAVSAAFGPVGVPPGGGSPTGAEGAATAAAAAKGGALLKIVGGTALAAAVATGVWASRSGVDRPVASADVAATSEAAPRPREDAAPAIQPGAAEVEPDRPIVEPDPPIVEPDPTGDPSATPEPAPPDPSIDETTARPRRRKPDPASPKSEVEPRGLAEEIALVESLRRAVVRADYATAKALAARHGREFPDGSLVPDRLDLQATAHCASGDPERGRALAKELARRFPEAPASDRLTKACTAEDAP